MLLQKGKLMGFKNSWSHVLVLDAVVGEQGGGAGAAELHLLKAAEVQLRDTVVTGEQLFQGCVIQPPQPLRQHRRPLQQGGPL